MIKSFFLRIMVILLTTAVIIGCTTERNITTDYETDFYISLEVSTNYLPSKYTDIFPSEDLPSLTSNQTEIAGIYRDQYYDDLLQTEVYMFQLLTLMVIDKYRFNLGTDPLLTVCTVSSKVFNVTLIKDQSWAYEYIQVEVDRKDSRDKSLSRGLFKFEHFPGNLFEIKTNSEEVQFQDNGELTGIPTYIALYKNGAFYNQCYAQLDGLKQHLGANYTDISVFLLR